jgi:predicted SAM-dependent methyltransferase
MRKINLGSGPINLEGWENFDWGLLPFLGKWGLNKLLCRLGILSEGYNQNWSRISLVDIRRRLPLDDKLVDFIYCSHVLEHFKESETRKILIECKRVLKDGGIIRVVLPDLDRLVKNYKGPKSFNNEIYGYEKEKYNSFLGQIMESFIRAHQWMYNFDSFFELMKSAGYKNIEKKSFKRGRCPDIERLDLDIYRKTSFYIEAKK